MRHALTLATLLALTACAVAPRETTLTGICRLDDPASKWVVRNNLKRQATALCTGGYERLGEKVSKSGSSTKISWQVRCQGS